MTETLGNERNAVFNRGKRNWDLNHFCKLQDEGSCFKDMHTYTDTHTYSMCIYTYIADIVNMTTLKTYKFKMARLKKYSNVFIFKFFCSDNL